MACFSQPAQPSELLFDLQLGLMAEEIVEIEPARHADGIPCDLKGVGPEMDRMNLEAEARTDIMVRQTALRRLLLLRHAKSAWPDGVSDFDRPLAPRGRKAAKRMGAYLRDEQLVPDLALISPARRARETWDRVKPHLGPVSEHSEPRLYEASVDGLLTVVRETEPAVRTLLILGHNPGLEE